MAKHGAAYLQATLTPEIEAAVAEGRAPDFSVAGPGSWVLVLDRLLAAGKIEVVRAAAQHFHLAFPKSAYGRTLCSTLDRLPPATEVPPFADTRSKDFQVVTRERSETLALMFCDATHRFGIPLSLAHRFFGRMPATLAYLRDLERLLFLAGVPSLGASRAETLDAIRELAMSMGARRIVCLGNSGGTFAALLYGLELKADAVVGFAGPTNLSPAFTENLRPVLLANRTQKLSLASKIDLRKAYSDADGPPRVALIYGNSNWDDRIQAEHMARLPSCLLRPIPGFKSHNVLLELIRRDQLQSLLDWVLSPETELPEIPDLT